MEVIIIITKEVADDAEARIFTEKIADLLSTDQMTNDPVIRIQSETRSKIET